MVDRRKPENAALRKQWVTLTAYAELYDVDPRTVKKWADAGVVHLERVSIAGKRALVRVKNVAPWDGRTT
jgi:hypothetical protein